MRKNNIKLHLFLIIVLSSLVSFVFAATSGDPVSSLQYIANNMIAGLKANQATLKSKPSIVYGLAYKYVVPHANLDEMSKRVLPPRIWNSATETERKEFQKLFTTTVIRTYASALTNYKDQKIKFYPLRGSQGKTVEIKSQIISRERSPINVSYRLIRADGSWKLYDMSVEGVSMLSSFRAQFADILSKGNMHTLLSRLSHHNRR